MALSFSTSSAFTTWMHLRLALEESGFDDGLFEECERMVLGQPITTNLAALQVATVVRAGLEDGEASSRLSIEAMQRLIEYIARQEISQATSDAEHQMLTAGILSGQFPRADTR